MKDIERRVHSSLWGRQDELIESIKDKLMPRTASSTAGTVHQHELSTYYHQQVNDLTDIESIIEALPDLELVFQIAISSILSSKDLINTSIVYDCNTTKIPTELKTDMLRIIKKFFDDTYKLPNTMYDILYDTLFKKGSYPIAIIPESAVDSVIKSIGKGQIANENVIGAIKSHEPDKPKNILGKISDSVNDGSQLGIEAIMSAHDDISADDLIIHKGTNTLGEVNVTDNPDIMKLPEVERIINKRKVASAYGMDQRSVDKGTNLSLEYGSITHNNDRVARTSHIVTVPTSEEGTVNRGRPLVMLPPAESVIPVHVPGNPKSHIGYFILIDRVGNPVSRNDTLNNPITSSWLIDDGVDNHSILNDAAKSLGIKTKSTDKFTISKLNDAYADLVEHKLISSLKNGINGSSATISRPDEVYRIMLARTLAGQNTQILYIPSEQFVYFAIDYKDNGIGRSLLDKTKALATARTAISLATTQSSLRNAMRSLKYTITLDPKDKKGQKTVAETIDLVASSFNRPFPVMGNINDINAYMANSGLCFEVEGNDYFASTKIDSTDVTPDYKVPDTDLIENLAKDHYRALGVDPDLIISGDSIEFATQVLSKDLIATKQTCKRQEKIAPHITHFIKTYIVSDGTLLGELAETIQKHYSNSPNKLDENSPSKIINRFLEFLTATLPPPDMTMIASQMNAYEDVEEAIEKHMEVWLDEDVLAEAELSVDVDTARSMVSKWLKRAWFRQNNILPDIIQLFDAKEIRAELIKDIADDNVRIAELVSMAMKRTVGRIETVDNRINENVDSIVENGEIGNDDASAADDLLDKPEEDTDNNKPEPVEVL